MSITASRAECRATQYKYISTVSINENVPLLPTICFLAVQACDAAKKSAMLGAERAMAEICTVSWETKKGEK